jgi:uncharacterized protein YndB with AHSA1/START domain
MAANPRANTHTAMESSEWDLVITRVFDAPRRLVWKVWSDPAHIVQWWGPKGFTNPRCEWDPRPKGSIRIDMRGPDGTIYPMNGVFQEIVEPERIVFRTAALDESGKPMFEVLNTAEFTEQGEKTKLTLQLRVLTTTARAPQYLKGMEMGWNQSLDRLADHLSDHRSDDLAGNSAPNGVAMLEGDREIACVRIVDANRDLVWQMFTDPTHIPHWWGPQGFTTTVQEIDVKPGGIWRLVMHGPDGRNYPNTITYREVEKPERLVFENTPGHGDEPVSHRTTIVFTAQGDKTRIDFRMMFPSAAQRDYVAKTYGAVDGLTQTLSRLAERVEKMSGREDE